MVFWFMVLWFSEMSGDIFSPMLEEPVEAAHHGTVVETPRLFQLENVSKPVLPSWGR
jgi:hypothetical protein